MTTAHTTHPQHLRSAAHMHACNSVLRKAAFMYWSYCLICYPTTVMKMIAPRKDPAVTGELQEVGTCTLPFSKQQPLKDCLLHKLKNYMDTENPPHKSCLKALFTALRHLKKWPREMMVKITCHGTGLVCNIIRRWGRHIYHIFAS
ncbi:hypothetical protein NC651_019710 [Populus alba x Populus x berolinensis]|nr:hypothetical protein NC651_019710 [Populus alba x Populus x berolinensis]